MLVLSRPTRLLLLVLWALIPRRLRYRQRAHAVAAGAMQTAWGCARGTRPTHTRTGAGAATGAAGASAGAGAGCGLGSWSWVRARERERELGARG
ncbi:hypothetical protein FIBSPDRAFT_869561 [Athelia psychrophila]|uniref:Secreted protein n=1 Tax=Athelia psychrophila TaxID=1759441 RepID=A0A166BZ94_9AGAM|nr:hypothetical protein FIBSPDRAFT_869561 [Fibularhizoctonia sp. CBS 109695]